MTDIPPGLAGKAYLPAFVAVLVLFAVLIGGLIWLAT